MLTKEEGKELLELARKSIESKFSDDKVDLSGYTKYADKRGVFVSLHKHGELRGCIGFPEPVYPLKQAVFEAARAAAFEDPRFGPLEYKELAEIDVELSVLTVPEEIKVKSPDEYLNRIKIGEDGLIIRGLYGSGLLLPQVFTEDNCKEKQALEMTCEKAGLPKDAWKDPKNKILKFQAQIFNED